LKDETDILAAAARLGACGRAFALVTVVRTSGSTPRKPGAKMIVCADGELIGTVGGGRIEQELVTEAQTAIAEWRPRVAKRHLTHELAMCCGGEMEAFIEPMGRIETLVLVGGGHINCALAPIVRRLGFSLVVVDEQEEFASAERFGDARLVHAWEPKEWGVAWGPTSYIVIATRDHAVDQKVLEELAELNVRPAYLGVIGSRGKMGRFRRRLEHKGVAADWIELMRGPIGVDVGAETPEEIAVAVAAELIGVRRRHGRTPTGSKQSAP
jgi:xanthine dehydrogenase accessory factor